MPPPVAGFTAWWDASDTSSITHSLGAVSQWADKSANGFHLTQTVASSKPVTGTRTQNGRNVVDFDGVDDILSSTLTLTQAQPFTIFAVFKNDGPTSASRQEFFSIGTTGPEMSVLNTSQYQLRAGANLVGGWDDQNAHLMTGVFNGASSQLWVDGVSLGTGDAGAGAANLDVLSIGAEPGSAFFNGTVGEVVLYPSLLNTTDRQLVDAYLLNKWLRTPVGSPPVLDYMAWYDASDLSSITHSLGAVSQWNDKSGNGNHLTQTVAANKPATGSRTQNGRNVVDFTDDWLRSEVLTQPQPFTIFALIKYDAPNVGNPNPYSFGNAGPNAFAFNGSFALFAGASQAYGAADANPHIHTAIANGASSQLFLDGTLGFAGDVGAGGLLANRLWVGTWSGDSNSVADCWVGEWIIYSKVLSSAERQAVEAYLRQKWIEGTLPSVIRFGYAVAARRKAVAPIRLHVEAAIRKVDAPDDDSWLAELEAQRLWPSPWKTDDPWG